MRVKHSPWSVKWFCLFYWSLPSRIIAVVRFLGLLKHTTNQSNAVTKRVEVMNMDKKVEVISTEKGIQVNITADNPTDIREIQEHRQWYSDILREHEPESEHAAHHREHHGSHSLHSP